TAEFLYPELFRSIGTIGHEMMSAAQSFDRSLEDAEYEMMERFVTRMGQASLLCDLVDAESVGLENALRVIRAHPETSQVGIRVDSGDIAEQCVLYFRQIAGPRHHAAPDHLRGRSRSGGHSQGLRSFSPGHRRG